MSMHAMEKVPSNVDVPAQTEKHDDATLAQAEDTAALDVAEGAKRGARFWMIIASVLISTFLSALDLSALSTALPTIAEALNTDQYLWIGSAYTLASTAMIPPFGSLAHVFGRKPPLIASLVLFAIGSVLCGAAPSIGMMIAGRTIAGIGGGGILALAEIVIVDLVPLSQRGPFIGLFGLLWAMASIMGPVIGGALAKANWRWLFYLNLPLVGIALAFVMVFMQLRIPEGSVRDKLKRIDWIGSGFFIASSTSLILGLTFGGSDFPWKSYHVILPIILGIVGLGIFFYTQTFECENPTVPLDIMHDSTANIGFLAIFLHGIASIAVFYFMPTYFQAVKGTSAVKSGVNLFSISFTVAPFAIVAGAWISIVKKYRFQNVLGFGIMTVGAGLLTLFKTDSPFAIWALIPCVFGIGTGLMYSSPMFAVQAAVRPDRQAIATAFGGFIRSFGQVFGVVIGGVALNNQLAKHLPAEIPQTGSDAYSLIPMIATLPEPLRHEVRDAFSTALQTIWYILIPICGIGFFATMFLKNLDLTTTTEAEWGMSDAKAASSKRSSSDQSAERV